MTDEKLDPQAIKQIGDATLVVRGKRVLIDSDLATLYGVTTKALNQAIKRNAERFPADFMFRISIKELRDNRSQFVTGSKATEVGSTRHSPLPNTEPSWPPCS